MCQNSVKIILFIGSLLLCLFRLGFGRVLQMCVCVCACVSVHKGKGGVRGWDVFHMHTCKACVKWIEKLTEQEMLLRERESVDVLFFFFLFFAFRGFDGYVLVGWAWGKCLSCLSPPLVSWYLIASNTRHPLPKTQNKVDCGIILKWSLNSNNNWIDGFFQLFIIT